MLIVVRLLSVKRRGTFPFCSTRSSDTITYLAFTYVSYVCFNVYWYRFKSVLEETCSITSLFFFIWTCSLRKRLQYVNVPMKEEELGV